MLPSLPQARSLCFKPTHITCAITSPQARSLCLKHTNHLHDPLATGPQPMHQAHASFATRRLPMPQDSFPPLTHHMCLLLSPQPHVALSTGPLAQISSHHCWHASVFQPSPFTCSVLQPSPLTCSVLQPSPLTCSVLQPSPLAYLSIPAITAHLLSIPAITAGMPQYSSHHRSLAQYSSHQRSLAQYSSHHCWHASLTPIKPADLLAHLNLLCLPHLFQPGRSTAARRGLRTLPSSTHLPASVISSDCGLATGSVESPAAQAAAA